MRKNKKVKTKMKFLKIIVKNFKPYLDETIIPLYTSSNADAPITAIVGPNGTGKTSICDAVLWAIYGKEQEKDLSKYTNNIAKDLTEAKKELRVPVSVKLDLEIDGTNYQIVRNSIFNIQTKNEEENIVTIIKDGSPIGETPDSVDWLKKNFPPYNVIKYYIFSAEEMLDEFELRKEDAVKDHINNITGITALAEVEKSLTSVIEKYEDEKSSIRRSQRGFDTVRYDEAKAQVSLKQKAIEGIDADIELLEGDKNNLFPQGPSPTDKEIKNKFEELNKLEEENKKLEEDFLPESNPSSFLPKAHFIFLKEIITKCIAATSKTPISKADWDSATSIIKSVLGGKFSGVLIESNKIELIDRTTSIPQEKLTDDNKLTLATVASNQSNNMPLFLTSKSLADSHIEDISKPIVSFLANQSKQIDLRQKLKTLGQELDDQTIVDSIDSFLALEGDIASKIKNKGEIKSQLVGFAKTKTEMEAKQKLTAEKQKDIDKIDEKITYVNKIQDVFKKTDDLFSNELINTVTEQATKIFMGVIKDAKKRYSGIKITNKYEIQVLHRNGKPLDPKTQVSKGTLEMALFCFLLSLPAYVQKPIPYFVDNPFMRLDSGNAERLLEQFVGLGRQIIINLIPGPEYSPDYFNNWLGKRINTQNYIEIEDDTKYNTDGVLHTIQNYAPEKVIGYRHEDL